MKREDMAQIQPKGIFVGPEHVAEVLTKLRPDWEFLPSVETIGELWDGWMDGSITRDIEAILIVSRLFDHNGEDTSFEELIVSISPYCFIGILNYDPKYKKLATERIEDAAFKIGANSLHYYFIDPKTANVSLESALNEFKQSTDDDIQDTIKVLEGIADEEDVDRADSVNEDEDDDEEDLLDFYDDDEDNEGSGKKGKIIAVTSSKGGPGKSTIACELSTYLSKASKGSIQKQWETEPLKVLLVDMDVRDGQVGFLTGLNKPTIVNLHNEGLTDENIENNIIHQSAMGIDVLLASKRPKHSFSIDPEFYRRLFAKLRKEYDYIILDTSVNYLDPLLAQVCYPIADRIIYVTEPVITSVLSMTRWILEVTNPKNRNGLDIPKTKIGIVINKFQKQDPGDSNNFDPERIKRSAQGIPILSVVPSAPKAIATAANNQSMESLLNIDGIRKTIGRIAKSITGDEYRLP